MAKTIRVVSVGKVHDPKLQDAISYYETCATGAFRIIWHILAPPKVESSRKAAIASESNNILRTLKDAEYVILLDELGSMPTSEEFSSIVMNALATYKDVTFIIGGAFGVDESVKKRADKIISFGRMVLPHQLMRLVLCEQLYRATTIYNNGSYHHA